MYRYIRELKDPDFRTQKFWLKTDNFTELSFENLVDYCGLDLKPMDQFLPWFDILKRNFKEQQVLYFKRRIIKCPAVGYSIFTFDHAM